MSDLHAHKIEKLGDLVNSIGRIGWRGYTIHDLRGSGPLVIGGTQISKKNKITLKRPVYLSVEKYEESPEIKVRVGDIILVKTGNTIGKVAYIDKSIGDACINPNTVILRSKGGKLEYLFQVLTSDDFQKRLWDLVAIGAQPSVNQAELKKLEIYYPPGESRLKIAKILSTVDNLIEKTQTLIEKYTAIKQGMMADLFTRGIDMTTGDTPNSKGEKLRPSVEDAPELYKQTELGWIPKEWEVKRLEYLLSDTPSAMRSGPFGSSLLKHELVEKGIPLLGIDNIFVERFSGTYRRFVTPEKFNELSKYAVRPNDVVITIMGTVGRCCVVPDDIEKALSSKHLWTMTFDKQKVISDLICWQLNYADWAKSWFHQKSQGGIMEAIQSSTLKNLLLPVPSLDEQLKIAEIYRNLCTKIGKEQAYLNKLSLKKKGLMQDLLTGKVKVQ
jgi:type I restriction enzyme S subunit